jgi:hypothetical protein
VPRAIRQTAGAPPDGLSLREVEVAALVAHVRHILDKLDVCSRTQIAAWASEQGRSAFGPSYGAGPAGNLHAHVTAAASLERVMVMVASASPAQETP